MCIHTCHVFERIWLSNLCCIYLLLHHGSVSAYMYVDVHSILQDAHTSAAICMCGSYFVPS